MMKEAMMTGLDDQAVWRGAFKSATLRGHQESVGLVILYMDILHSPPRLMTMANGLLRSIGSYLIKTLMIICEIVPLEELAFIEEHVDRCVTQRRVGCGLAPPSIRYHGWTHSIDIDKTLHRAPANAPRNPLRPAVESSERASLRNSIHNSRIHPYGPP